MLRFFRFGAGDGEVPQSRIVRASGVCRAGGGSGSASHAAIRC
jgi:hypothetical protein